MPTPAAFTFIALQHLQPHSHRHMSGHLINTTLSLPLCVPCSRHLPIPPLACATLHLPGIISEPPESTEKKDKKIGPNENQKHRLFLLLLLSLPPLPWTWKDERGGELNLIQTSSLQRLWRLWSVSVRVWAFRSLILSLSPLPRSSTFFYERMGKALKHCRLTIYWLVWWTRLPLKDRVHFPLKQVSPGC